MRVVGAVLRVVPAVLVLVVAVLAATHDAVWSIVVAMVLGVVAVVLLRRVAPGGGRVGVLLCFVACALVLFGGTSALRAGWLDAFGRVSTATVTGVSSHCQGHNTCDRVEDYSLRLPDGDAVAGKITDYRPGAFHVGDTVTVRYDPSGIVRSPRSVHSSSHRYDLIAGAVATVVGLALAIGLAVRGVVRRPAAPAPAWAPPAAGQRSNL